jgi:hypothetical protein
LQIQTGTVATPQKPAPGGQAPASENGNNQVVMGPPAPVPTPMRPADMPPAPPKVTFHNGMLSVEAVNSSLAGLLTAIRNKTGIEFEGAENASERVAVTAGPAPEGEVLATIFSGSGFDYVVVGRPDSPGIVQRVLLTPKARPGQPVTAGANQPPAAQQQPPEGDEDAQDDAAAPDADPQDTAAQPPAETQQQPQGTADQQQQQQQQNGPKTPEQLLQELKEMQQKQQQQQGAPPPNTQAVPRKPTPPQ